MGLVRWVKVAGAFATGYLAWTSFPYWGGAAEPWSAPTPVYIYFLFASGVVMALVDEPVLGPAALAGGALVATAMLQLLGQSQSPFELPWRALFMVSLSSPAFLSAMATMAARRWRKPAA